LLLVPVEEKRDEAVMFDALVTETALRETTRQLFLDGHYALAVEEGYKCLNNVVKSRSGLSTDGASLMRTTFSPKGPLLKLNALETDSERDQQLGYMDIFAGCMTGIRNPRAHEHRYLDEPEVAIELLALANHLLRMVNSAKRTRKASVVGSTP
jgi:uncharacterized protein (TIGR02391 family)